MRIQWTSRTALLPLLLPLTVACDEPPVAPPVIHPRQESAPSADGLTFIDLGTLGGSESWALGINAAGEVVGTSMIPGGRWHAFLWTAGGGMQDVGTLPAGGNSAAYEVNGAGTMVGYSGGRPFSRTRAGQWRDLLAGGGSGAAYAINERDEIVGGANTGSGTRAFLDRPGAGMVFLTQPGSPSVARDINDSSLIAGEFGSGSYFTSGGFVMRYPGPMRVIAQGGYVVVRGINNAGRVVGSIGARRHGRAFVWDSVAGLRYLPDLTGRSEASDIDDAGRISGYVDRNNTGPRLPVVWTPRAGGGYDLTYLPVFLNGEVHAMNGTRFIGNSRIGSAQRATQWFVGTPLPPAAPTALTAVARAARRMDLAWTDASNNESYIEVLRSVRDPDGAFPPPQPLRRLESNVAALTDTSVHPGGAYRYQVRACNAQGCAGSAEVTAAIPPPPVAPAGLVATVASSSLVRLDWEEAGGSPDHLWVWRSDRLPDGSFAPARPLRRIPSGSREHADSTVAAGGVYAYRVQACNVVGCANSGAVRAGIPLPPAAPTGLMAVVVAGWRIDLAWQNASANENALRVRRSTRAPDGSYPPYQALGTLPPGTDRYEDTTATAGGAYRYLVESCNPSGCALSDAVGATVPLPPAAPTGVAVRRVGAARVQVSWTDASTNETSFRVRRTTRRSDGTYGQYRLLGTAARDASRFDDDTVVAGNTYHYLVDACLGASCATSDRTAWLTVP